MTQVKGKNKKSGLDWLIIGILVLILLVVARATWGLYWKNQRALSNLRSSALRFDKLTEREVILRDKIERLKTPRGIEEEIRNNFPVAKPGERVINFVEEDEKSSLPATTTKKWWQIW
jgi:cell division protein FtsB